MSLAVNNNSYLSSLLTKDVNYNSKDICEITDDKEDLKEIMDILKPI